MTDRPPGRSAGVSATTAAPPRVAAPPLTAATFDALYRATADDLYAYVATLVRDRAAAEDVVAAAFERAYRRVRSYDPRRGSARQWLFGIARNAALDELRRRRRHATLAVDPEDPAAAAALASHEDGTDGALRRTAVRAALDGLSPRERELVALKFHAGLSNAEIARVLGVSESNAGTLLHRTIAKLRKACDA